MTIKIEIPSEDQFKPLAVSIGRALMQWGDSALDPATKAILSQVNANATDPKTVDELAADAVKAGDPNLTDSAPAADGFKAQAESTGSTSTETQSQTTPGATASAAATAGDVPMRQNAAGSMYEGHPIDPELGVPVDGKGFPLCDTYGVPFDADHCGRGAKPFYGSGKEKGMWKAKVGYPGGKEAFMAWHAQQLENVGKPNTDDELTGPSVDAADGFATPSGAADADDVAATFGSLIKWSSEMQGAERLTQEQISQAYAACQTDITAMMPDSALVTRQAVYQTLKAMAGA